MNRSWKLSQHLIRVYQEVVVAETLQRQLLLSPWVDTLQESELLCLAKFNGIIIHSCARCCFPFGSMHLAQF